jgi:hypothetical protein
MAYSRWSTSPWYSFWRSDSGPSKDEQILCLWYSMEMTKDWTYKQAKEMGIAELTIEYAGVPHDHIILAQGIIAQFISDVDQEFKMEYNK